MDDAAQDMQVSIDGQIVPVFMLGVACGACYVQQTITPDMLYNWGQSHYNPRVDRAQVVLPLKSEPVWVGIDGMVVH